MADTMDIMMKLFDTLKQASDKHEETLQKLIEQQQILIGHVEYLPFKELQKALEDHNSESSENIDACTEKVETTSEKILKKVSLIEGKISKMILVVIVAFSLLSTAFLIGRLSQDTKEIEAKIKQAQKIEHQLIIETINKSVREQFDKLKKETGRD
jgi:hypothetical protein